MHYAFKVLRHGCLKFFQLFFSKPPHVNKCKVIIKIGAVKINVFLIDNAYIKLSMVSHVNYR